jgi:hypothetical protein
VAAISDFRSDSPLNFICIVRSDLGSSEHRNRGCVFTVVAIVRFCCHSEVFGFHDPSSIHKPSSHTRDCSQPYSSPWFSASSNLRCAGVIAILKLSSWPTERHFLSALSFARTGGEPGMDLNKVAQLFARVPSGPRRIVRENNGARVCVLSGTTSVAQGFSSARVIRFTTHRSLTSPRFSLSDRAGHRRPDSRSRQQHVTTSGAQLLRKSPATQAHSSYDIPSKQPTERSSSCIKVEEQ